MAAEEKNEAESAQPLPSSSGGSGGKLVLILSAVNILAVMGMAAVLLISFQREKKASSVQDIAIHEPAHAEGEKAEGGHGGGHGGGAKEGAGAKVGIDFGKMVTLEQFTINLATPGSVTPKYARVNISLEVPNTDTENEVNSKMPQIRNAIIDLFNSKRPSDLATAEGRDYLKEEIKNALNGFMVTGKIRGVFFTNFAVAG